MYVKFLNIKTKSGQETFEKCDDSPYYVNLANGVVNQPDARYIINICDSDVKPAFFSDDASMTIYHHDEVRDKIQRSDQSLYQNI